MAATKRIRISEENQRQLHEMKDVGESYDDVITELIREHNRRELFERMKEADENPDDFVPLRELGDE